MLPLIVMLVLTGTPKADPKLAGRWILAGETFCTLRADGSGELDGSALRWGVDGGQLVLSSDGETERVAYSLSGDLLTLNMGGIPITLTRAGKAGTSPEPKAVTEAPSAPAKKGKAPAGRAAGNDQLSQLLLSSAWCSFSYNKHSGATNQSRVQFFPNGSWSSASQAETYNSGASGTVAGQYNDGSGGQWSVKGGQLYMSNPPEEPTQQPVQPFSVTLNSNGSPIINAMGKEYMRCN
jgi:hypothetical protein